jgi:MYXO-CTERM domain-containing protein
MRPPSLRPVWALALLLAAAAPLRAGPMTVVTFDDLTLPAGYGQVPNGYAGLNWTNAYAYNPNVIPFLPVGYTQGVVSPQQAMTNGGLNGVGAPVILTSTTPIDVFGADFTSATGGWMNVEVFGFSKGVLKYDTWASAGSFPNWDPLNMTGVDQVLFVPQSSPFWFPGGSFDKHFIMDNLTIGASTPLDHAPEPGALTLGVVGVGLAGLFGWRRRRAA